MPLPVGAADFERKICGEEASLLDHLHELMVKYKTFTS